MFVESEGTRSCFVYSDGSLKRSGIRLEDVGALADGSGTMAADQRVRILDGCKAKVGNAALKGPCARDRSSPSAKLCTSLLLAAAAP